MRSHSNDLHHISDISIINTYQENSRNYRSDFVEVTHLTLYIYYIYNKRSYWTFVCCALEILLKFVPFHGFPKMLMHEKARHSGHLYGLSMTKRDQRGSTQWP